MALLKRDPLFPTYLFSLSMFKENRSQVDIIYTDFSKALNQIYYGILLHKLNNYFGFSESVLVLVKSYPTDKLFLVKQIRVACYPVKSSSRL